MRDQLPVSAYPEAPRTHLLGILGPKTILHKAFWATLSLRVSTGNFGRQFRKAQLPKSLRRGPRIAACSTLLAFRFRSLGFGVQGVGCRGFRV